MTRRDELIALRDAVRGGVELAELAAVMPCQKTTDLTYSAHRGSLDAAKALHDAVLPGWDWEVAGSNGAAVFYGPHLHGPAHLAAADTPARAWLLAILEALISQEPD